MDFAIIKKNYDKGLWNSKMVAVAVKKGVISADQYSQIVREEIKQSKIRRKS